MVRVTSEPLESFVIDTCRTLGTTDEVAAAVAESLVEADLRGHGSHGVLRLPIYADRVDRGRINATSTPKVASLGDTLVHVDGQDGFGQYIGRVMTDALIDHADGGVAVAGVRNGGHLGRLGEWAERVADSGYLFIALASGTTPVVAPAGSADRRFSTNPIAFGVPTFDALAFPIVLDIATSQAAYGKIRKQMRTGEPIPDGWAVSHSGKPVDDAIAFRDGEGALRPLGGEVAGHKGYGLSVIAELFAAFTGNAGVTSQDVHSAMGNAATFVAIDPRAFSTEDDLEDRIASLTAYLRETTPSSNISTGIAATDEVGLLPGEPEHRTRCDCLKRGIDIDERVVKTLRDLAVDLGLESSLPDVMRNP